MICWFAQIPENDGANRVVICVVDGQEVKGLLLPMRWILILLLRELTVIQVTRVKASLR